MKKDKEIGKIYETKEYEKFSFFKSNRIINRNNLVNLDKSVQENGWKIEPITVNEKYQIGDGQHRYVYAKENKLPLYYIIIPGFNEEDCQRINSSRKNWVATDFIRHFTVLGNISYWRLMYLNEHYPSINLTSIVYALVNSHSAGGYIKKIINGKFECTADDYENATEILDYVNSLMESIKKIKGKKVSLINAIIWLYKNELVDSGRLATQIETFANEMSGITDMESALANIERYYNYNLKKKDNVVYLVTEWKKRK